MLLHDLLPNFRTYMDEQRDFSPTTVRAYMALSRRFVRWLGKEASLDEVTHEVIRRYITEFKATHRPRTIHSTYSGLIVLGDCLVAQGYATENPARGIPMPKLDEPRRAVPQEEEIRDMLSACERIADNYRCRLARAIVSVLVFTGMRRAELLNLRLDDVDFKQQTITIQRGKGGKSRVVYPPPECFTAIGAYLSVRIDCENDYLFAVNRIARLGDAGLRKLLREVFAIAGKKETTHMNPHSLRHAYASRLLAKGASLEVIRRALGHSKLATTAIYLHANEKQMRQSAELASLGEPAPQPPPPPEPPKESTAHSPSGLPQNAFYRRRIAFRR